MGKKAVVTGVLGQGGSTLADLLLEKGYEVYGVHRRNSILNTENITDCLNNENFHLVCCDITDSGSVSSLVSELKPDYFYNMAAQSFVKASFDQPVATFQADTVGVLNILDSVVKLSPSTRFFTANTSEMFGSNYSVKYDYGSDIFKHTSTEIKYQDENTPFKPCSPYGVAKLASHHLVDIYRKSYGIFAVSGILFNYESKRRSKEFLTRKVTDYIGRLVNKKTNDYLYLGNLNSARDFSHCEDTMRAIVMMTENSQPVDYVVSSMECTLISDFVDMCFAYAGLKSSDYVKIDQKHYRPCEVDYLRGSSEKIRKELNWSNIYNVKQIVTQMVDYDIKINER